MKRVILLAVVLLCGVVLVQGQTWTPVWKLEVPAYLTKADITDMAMVKAGFDTDKDGWGEFICTWTDADTNAIMMYEATGDNTYKLVWSWVYPIPGNSFAGIAVGDVNNNGVVEIITCYPSVVGTDPNPLRVWFFEWNGVTGKNDYGIYDGLTQTFGPSGGYNFGVADNYDLRPYSLTVDDMNGDGKNELIAGIRQAGSPAVREVYVVGVDGDFNGFYFSEVKWKFSGALGGGAYSTTTGDLDGDGKREIHMMVWNKFTMRIFENVSDTSYTTAFSTDMLYAADGIDHGSVDGVRVADVNNDGQNEMYIVSTENVNQIFVVTGVTDVSTMTPANIKRLYTLPKTGLGGLRSMYIADPDHDGKQELMIAGERNGQIFSLEYKGSGDPADSANWQHQVIFDLWAVSGNTGISPRLFYGHPAGDMDKDGKDEYVFINYSPDYEIWSDDVPLWVIEMSSPTDVAEIPGTVPSEVRLLPNYPNPFNPATTLPFQLPFRSRVRLEVFNVYGEQVATLVNGERAAGIHEARWTAAVPSGTYFARLTVEPLEGSGTTVRDVRKMMLLK